MRFEHLIQINAIGEPGLEILSREQVWRGLALKAYDPAHFILGLEGCAIRHHRRESDREIVERTLHYGAFEVEDTVTLFPMERTRVEVEATEKWSRCSATAIIEEPEPLSIFIRFIYEWDDDAIEQALDDISREARRQAYIAADMDTVQRIREIARQPLS